MNRTARAAAAIALVLAASAALSPPAAQAIGGGPAFTETDPGQVNGTYTPVAGDFSNVEYYDDLLWYAPGAGAEHLWTNIGNRTFTKKDLGNKVTGTYIPIVGDFSGDSLDDILWYAPGSASDVLWRTSGDATFTSLTVSINGTYSPTVLDDHVGKDDIVWAKPGGGASSVWSFTGRGAEHGTHAVTAPTAAQPLAGDFDGDYYADLFWYGPGAAADSLWSGNGLGTFATTPQSVSGVYQPIVDDYTTSFSHDKLVSENDTDDIYWFKATGANSVWYGHADRTWTKDPNVGTIGIPAVPLNMAGETVLFWSTSAPDKLWNDGYVGPTNNTEVGVGYTPIVGKWYGVDTVLFYKPGPSPEILFT